MSFGDFENLTAAEKRLFVAKAALVAAVCLSLVFFLVSVVAPRQDDAWADNEVASAAAGSEDGSGIESQSALTDLANANSDVVTTETIDAAAREAQQAAANQDTREIEENHTPLVKDKMPGRNDPCPCGSGKKFKNCHGKGLE